MPDIILIDSQPYTVYEDVAGADLYLAASIHAANWTAAAELTKQMALITATRILDRQRWRGEKNVAGQDLAWPRKNTAVDGVEDDVVPANIVTAAIELALALVDGSEVQSQQSTVQTIAALSAGSVSISYFRGAEGAPLRFPLIVHELVRDYLVGTKMVYTGLASGTDGAKTDLDFGLSGPL